MRALLLFLAASSDALIGDTAQSYDDNKAACIGGSAYNVQTAPGNPVYLVKQDDAKLIKFLSRPNLFWPEDKRHDRIRSELQGRTKHPVGSLVTVKYDIYVAATPQINSDSLVLGQFHATSDIGDFAGYPAFEINLERDGLAIYTAAVADRIQSKPYPHVKRVGAIPFTLSQWHSLSIDLVPSFSNDGSLCVKLDQRKIFCEKGISIGMNDKQGLYWKFGIYYRPATSDMTLSVWYRNFLENPLTITNDCSKPGG